MKIECPTCHLSGKINELEMPPEGSHINCPRCKETFHVAKPAPTAWGPGMMNTCPACRYSTYGVEMFAVCPKCGIVGSEYQERERLKREKEQLKHERELLHGSRRNPQLKTEERPLQSHEQELLQRSLRNQDFPKSPDAELAKAEAPMPVRATAWPCIVAGGALLCYGASGLTNYYQHDWQTILSEPLLEPLSTMQVFFRMGFAPWLFTLFSLFFLTMAGRFLMMQPKSPRGLGIAAWTGVAVVTIYEGAGFLTWVGLSSDEASISYYLVGVIDFLFMSALWSAPCFLLIWVVQRDWILREFPDS